MWPAKPKMLLSGPLQKKFANPWSRVRDAQEMPNPSLCRWDVVLSSGIPKVIEPD